MGLIKEPEGVDFIIESTPLTEKEKKEISDFIKKRRAEKKQSTKRRISVISKFNFINFSQLVFTSFEKKILIKERLLF